MKNVEGIIPPWFPRKISNYFEFALLVDKSAIGHAQHIELMTTVES